MVVKNRFGAGGGFVFRVSSRKELLKYFKLSVLDLCNVSSAGHFASMLGERLFYWELIKAKRARYPFLSAPLLAQQYVEHDRDLKTVVGNERVVEAHWRIKAGGGMWKVNIDGGGIGVWAGSHRRPSTCRSVWPGTCRPGGSTSTSCPAATSS